MIFVYNIKNKKITSAFYSHMKKKTGHANEIEWGKCMNSDREKNWRSRRRKAIYSNAINPTESMVHQEVLILANDGEGL